MKKAFGIEDEDSKKGDHGAAGPKGGRACEEEEEEDKNNTPLLDNERDTATRTQESEVGSGSGAGKLSNTYYLDLL